MSVRRVTRLAAAVLWLAVAAGALASAAMAGVSPTPPLSVSAPVTRIVSLHLPAEFAPATVELGTFTPSGNVWLAAHVPGDIGTWLIQVNPRTGREITAVNAGLNIETPLNTGPDGNAWFAGDEKGRVLIGYVTPTGTVQRFVTSLTNKTEADPLSLASGPDGRVWFNVDNFGAQGVILGDVSTSGTVQIRNLSVFSSWASGLVATSLGRLYSTGANANAFFIPARLPTTGGAPQKFSELQTTVTTDQAGDVLGWDGDEIARATPSGQTTDYPWVAGSGVPGDIATGAITVASDSAIWFEASGSEVAGDTSFETDYVLGRIAPNGTASTWPAAMIDADGQVLGQFLQNGQDSLEPGPDGRLYAVGIPADGSPDHWRLYAVMLPHQPVMRSPKARIVSARASGHTLTVSVSCTAQPGRYCAGTISAASANGMASTSKKTYAVMPGFTQTYSLTRSAPLSSDARITVTTLDPETEKTATTQRRIG